MTLAQFRDHIRHQISDKILFGSDELIEHLTIAYLVGGHVLLEGPPGTGKTLAAKAFAQSLGGKFRRIQFTSDLLPADILGSHIYDPSRQTFNFIAGPLFADVVLADEVNRTPPRTQSALLEAMEERQVTVEGESHRLPPHFFVVATQNPFDHDGTFPLPEAQLDRFLFKVSLKAGSAEQDAAILREQLSGPIPERLHQIQPAPINVEVARQEMRQVRMDDSLLKALTKLLQMSRQHPALAAGASVRAGIALANVGRVSAAFQARDFVTPDDLRRFAVPVLRHRIRLTAEASFSGETDVSIVQELLKRAEFPV
ncbi:MAG TPA: MoxR family ATPase [Pseudobdellovibrionaceae bacterium]|nr:MoxR family ATPase [Pseudobdellovibrionaceae bacterium]